MIAAIAASQWAWATCYPPAWNGLLAASTAERVRMPLSLHAESYGPLSTDEDGNEVFDVYFEARSGESIDFIRAMVRVPPPPQEPSP